MKEYNFDENKDNGETVRIDDIKNKISEMEDMKSSEDYGDFDEDYDDLDEDYDYYEDVESGETAEVPHIRKRSRQPQKGYAPKKNKDSTNKMLLLIIAAIVMVIVVASAVIMVMKHADKDNRTVEDENTEHFYGVVASLRDNKFEIIDTQNGSTAFYTIDPDITVTKADGRKAAYSVVSRGDIIYIGLSEASGDIISIEYTDDVWEKDNFSDLIVNTDEKTISNGAVTYSYDKNTLFIYNGDFINADDLTVDDTVTLRGLDNKVWTVTVEKYHGFIKIENVDKIDGLKITIDNEEKTFEDNMVSVSAGVHSLGISGENIETLKVDIHVTAGEIYAIDMASVQEKTGVLSLNINVDDCIVVVDGKQVDKDSPIVLSMGSYPISVSAEGYKTYNGTVNISEPLVELAIELEKIEIKTAQITVESTPSGATVYANGAIIGVTPFTTQINYGDYQITVRKDGYEDYSLSTTVNEGQKNISVLLTEE